MVDIIPKQQETELSSIALTIAIVILVISVGSFGIFAFLKTRTESKLEEATIFLLEGKSKEQAELESQILDIKTKLEDFSVLALRQNNPSAFFEFIEENTHPDIIFSQLSLNPQDRKAVINGETRTFRNLQEQILLLKEQADSEEVELTSISLGQEGQVKFTLVLEFEHSFFLNL
ncbi:MAG: hypothetical protein KJI69_03105 [Patescibacteria group bacterium]|nr:hypothetical protein [Patescibacteria group bacterium]